MRVVPINRAEQVENQILRIGKVEHGRVGVEVQSVGQSLADSFKLNSPSAAELGGPGYGFSGADPSRPDAAAVDPGRAQAGQRVDWPDRQGCAGTRRRSRQQDDVVLEVDGTPVQSVAELRNLANHHGKEVALLIQRGARRTFTATDSRRVAWIGRHLAEHLALRPCNRAESFLSGELPGPAMCPGRMRATARHADGEGTGRRIRGQKNGRMLLCNADVYAGLMSTFVCSGAAFGLVALLTFSGVALGAETAQQGARRDGVIGALSQQIRQEVATAKACRVRQALSFSGGARIRVLSPDELRAVLGRDVVAPIDGRTFPNDQPIETVEVHAPHGLREAPLQASIPFGLAGIVWGMQHPTEAWRLVMPVIPT